MINIKKALFQAFLNITDIDESLIQVPNVMFNPPDGEDVWARLNYLPNIPEVGSLGDGGLDDVTGILQIDFNMRQGKGDEPVLEQVEQLRHEFTAGRYFEYSGQCVKIVKCGHKPGQIVDNFYRVTCNIAWFAQLTRNINK